MMDTKFVETLVNIRKTFGNKSKTKLTELNSDDQLVIKEGWLKHVLIGDYYHEEEDIRLHGSGIRIKDARVVFHDNADFRKSYVLTHFNEGFGEQHPYTFEQIQALAQLSTGDYPPETNPGSVEFIKIMLNSGMFGSRVHTLMTAAFTPYDINMFLNECFAPSGVSGDANAYGNYEAHLITTTVSSTCSLINTALNGLMTVKFFINSDMTPVFHITLPSGVHIVRANLRCYDKLYERYVMFPRDQGYNLSPIKYTPTNQIFKGDGVTDKEVVEGTDTPKQQNELTTTWDDFFKLVEHIAVRGTVKIIQPTSASQYTKHVLCFDERSTLASILSRMISSRDTFDYELFERGFGIENTTSDGVLRIVGPPPESVTQQYGVVYLDVCFPSNKKVKDLYHWMV